MPINSFLTSLLQDSLILQPFTLPYLYKAYGSHERVTHLLVGQQCKVSS